jgi:hypothetical protein
MRARIHHLMASVDANLSACLEACRENLLPGDRQDAVA